MNLPTRLALICTGVALLPLPHSFAQSPSRSTLLSASDRKIAFAASRLGARSPRLAYTWLVRQPGVSTARMGPDRQTLDVHFRDGAELALLPRTTHRTAVHLQSSQLRPMVSVRDTSPGKAIVLEPFADELGLGPDAGQGEITSLQAAGFSVDVQRNAEVTVSTMESLSNYSVVYMETHSGTLGDGDAIVLTRQTSSAGINNLFKDGSVAQGLAYGDQALYIAIKSQFVLQHMGKFPASSIIFLNGCELLGANVMWDAFHQQGVATMISWDNKVINTLDEQAADFMFPRLANGETVASNVEAAKAANLGTSTFGNAEAHLGYLGDGNNTFSNALKGVLPPTATPTITSTALPTPTATAIPTLPSVDLSFDTLATLDSGRHRTRVFPSHSSVHVNARYSVLNAQQKVSISIKRTVAYRRSKAWHTIGHPIRTRVTASPGTHVYRFTVVPESYHTQRISVAMTLAGQTHKQAVAITVTR